MTTTRKPRASLTLCPSPQHPPGLALSLSTVASPVMNKMFQAVKTAPKHTGAKGRHFCIGGQLITSWK